MNSQKDLDHNGGQMTLFSQEDFHVSPTHLPESEKAKMTLDISGLKCLESSEKFSRLGSWAKTFTGLLIGMKGWSLKRCPLIWKMKATKYNRIYYQLYPLAQSTEEIESGSLLKTPCAMDAYSENLTKKEQKFGNSGTLAQEVQSGFIYQRGLLPTPIAGDWKGQKRSDGTASMLSGKASLGMLPTPTAFDWNSARTPEKWEEDKQKWADKGVNLQMPLKQMARLQMLPTPTAMDSTNATVNMKSSQMSEGSMHSVTLTRAMNMGILPTPTMRDWKGKQASEYKQDRGEETEYIMESLPGWAAKQTGSTSQLNPLFVTEMMGFPIEWLILPFQDGEKNQ
jgi:hypothetical protein